MKKIYLMEIKKNKKLLAEGQDDVGLNNTTVLQFKFKEKPAYLLVKKHYSMHGAFGNNWKWQNLELNNQQTAIWNYIRKLDENFTYCLNDTYDQINDLYEDFWSEYDEENLTEENFNFFQKLTEDSDIVDFTKKCGIFTKEKCFVVEFVTLLEENISELEEKLQNCTDSELLLQSILYIQHKNRDFFEENIYFDESIIKQMKETFVVKGYFSYKSMKELDSTLKKKNSDKKDTKKV